MPLLHRMMRFFKFTNFVILIFILLTGCSSKKQPIMEATGFAADNGIVRLWRLDVNNKPQTLIAAYTPRAGNSALTRFEFIDGSLSQIINAIESNPKVTELLRFESTGELTFHERKRIDKNEMIDQDYIDYVKYVVSKLLELSEALIVGEVKLGQAEYYNGILTTCEGENITLHLEEDQMYWLEQRAKSNKRLWLSWLSSPSGRQLLLVANDNFCIWQPKKEQM